MHISIFSSQECRQDTLGDILVAGFIDLLRQQWLRATKIRPDIQFLSEFCTELRGYLRCVVNKIDDKGLK